MTRLSGLRVVVAGGGAVGSAVALAVRRAGAEVTLADPAPFGDNASGVAAGMLAPAFEAVLDPVSAGHFDIYRQARDLWPAFAAGLGRADLVHRCGAIWVSTDEAGVADMLARLAVAGAQANLISAAEAERLSPGVAAPAGAAHTEADWRLEPHAALAAMRAAFVAEGGTVRAAAVRGFAPGRAELSDGVIGADIVVLASGLAPVGWSDPPPELAALTPIKGQILRAVDAGPRDGPVIRGQGIYVVPGGSGASLGATMEAGLDDRDIDAQTTARLRAAATGLIPALASAEVFAAAGVRAATPDGLPLVGASSRPGVVLALGARRNGWLLAPTVAEAVVEALQGRAVPAGLDGRRFDQAVIRAGEADRHPGHAAVDRLAVDGARAHPEKSRQFQRRGAEAIVRGGFADHAAAGDRALGRDAALQQDAAGLADIDRPRRIVAADLVGARPADPGRVGDQARSFVGLGRGGCGADGNGRVRVGVERNRRRLDRGDGPRLDRGRRDLSGQVVDARRDLLFHLHDLGVLRRRQAEDLDHRRRGFAKLRQGRGAELRIVDVDRADHVQQHGGADADDHAPRWRGAAITAVEQMRQGSRRAQGLPDDHVEPPLHTLSYVI